MRRLPAIYAVAPAALLLLAAFAAQEARPLAPGQPVERELAGGQTHAYQINLSAQQYLHLIVEQRGIDVVVTLAAPGGQQLAEVDSPNGAQGPEPVALVTEAAGSYRVEIRSLEKNAAAGRYEIRIAELRAAIPQDKPRLAAARAFAEAQQLEAQRKAEASRQALVKYEEALAQWRAAEATAEQAQTLSRIGLLHYTLGAKQQALDSFQQALPLYRTTGNRQAEAIQLNDIGAVLRDLGEKRQAIAYFQQVLPLRRALNDRAGEALALNNLGTAYSDLGEREQARDCYQQALTLYRAVGNRGGAANTLTNLGADYGSLGEYQQALDHYAQALALWQTLNDRRGQATTLLNLGLLHSYLGEYQQALDYYQQALPIYRTVGNRQWEGYALNDIGSIYRSLGRPQQALEQYQQALALLRAVGDRQWEANTLDNIGRIYSALSDYRQALDHFQQALALRQAVGDRGSQALTLNNLAGAYVGLREHQKALDYYQQALALAQAVGGRRDEASALYGLAVVERERGNLSAARGHSAAALKVYEALRSKVASQSLRASLVAAVQNYYELGIDLLLRSHQQEPAQGFDAQALALSERARARSLLEILTEAHADIRQGVDPTLLERERDVQKQLNAKEQERRQLLARKHTPEQAEELETGLRELTAMYQAVQTQIRRTSPRYAALTQPQPLNLQEIQQQLDQETLLLEYALGEERSYLFAVTPEALVSFELPKRAEIEAAARNFYEMVRAPGQQTRGTPAAPAQTAADRQKLPAAAAALSRMLLAPVAKQLGNKRLLIVAEGALQYLPFAALPEPAKQTQPLIVEHEIISLPSASTLAVLRRETAERKPAAKALAVIADPVFSSEDTRVARTATAEKKAAPAPTHEWEQPLTRAVREAGLRLGRLPGTRREALGIAALLPAVERRQALDFDASRTTVTSAELSQYRIIHFATHGLLNSAHPELSGLVLSLVDQKGQPQDGFLRLHEIYNLKLPAELVVLSACQTALGKEIKGEGLVGLTRGFMYAGAPRVVAGLWNADDRATAELMKRFYQGMLTEKLRPAAALRAAQIAMWKARDWADPYYWAAFVLQGEWK